MHRSRLRERGGLPNTALRPHIADQRLFLAAEQKEHDSEHAEHAPTGRRKDRDHERIPEIPAGVGFNHRPELRQAAGVGKLPDGANAGQKKHVTGNRLGAIVDHQDEAGGQEDEPKKSK
jgi:hypothetical protein